MALLSTVLHQESKFKVKCVLNVWLNQPWSEFANGRPVTAAHKISNQRVSHSIPGPTHKQNYGNIEGLHLWYFTHLKLEAVQNIILWEVLNFYLYNIQKENLQGNTNSYWGNQMWDPTHSITHLAGQRNTTWVLWKPERGWRKILNVVSSNSSFGSCTVCPPRRECQTKLK